MAQGLAPLARVEVRAIGDTSRATCRGVELVTECFFLRENTNPEAGSLTRCAAEQVVEYLSNSRSRRLGASKVVDGGSVKVLIPPLLVRDGHREHCLHGLAGS